MKTVHKLATCILLPLLSSPVFAAGEYFATGFELPGNEPGAGWDLSDPETAEIPRPAWRLPPAFAALLGPNRRIDVSTAVSYTGDRSLVVNYTGDNSFCNICSGIGFTHVDDPAHDGADYFVAVDEGDVWGNNLATLENPNRSGTKDGPRAEVGKIVFNTSNDFSKWIITGVVNQNDINDRLNLRLVSRGTSHTSDDQAMFSAGDSISLTKRCGVDGTIGKVGSDFDRNRRSDCNAIIGWFGGTQPNDGTTTPRSIFMRYYLKVVIASERLHQKLHYFRAQDRVQGNDGTICEARAGFHTVADTHFGELQYNTKGWTEYGTDFNNLYRPGVPDNFGQMLPTDATFERDVWYYIEEEYQAATFAGNDANGCPTYNNDGNYRVWFSRADEAIASVSQGAPDLELANIPMAPIVGGSGTHVSFWGNIQHNQHTVGKWYIDSVSIGNTWSGPIPANSSAPNLPPPAPPVVQ